MRRLLPLILAAASCTALGACGYKGPLERPAPVPRTSPAATPASAASAPASARSG